MARDLLRVFGRVSAIALAIGSLAACGGDESGGGGTPSPPPPLTVTSGGTATVAENTGGTVYTAAASLSSGGQVSFSLAGGADAGDFAIQSDGSLSFVQTPDFERPADQDQDNVYEVSIRAAGGGVTEDFNVAVTVTNDKEGISVTRIATGFTEPVCIDFLNERPAPTAGPQGLIAVGEKGGKIFQVDGSTGDRVQLADVFEGRAPAEVIECKSYQRQRTGYYSGLYAAVREPDGRVWMQRYDRSELTVSELLPPGTAVARVSLIYGPSDEFLLAVGGASASAAQDPSSPLGKIFLLEGIDPYAGASVVRGYFTTTLIGTGLREPGGGSAVDGRFLLADRGESHEHELSFLRPNMSPFDLGWPSREGTTSLVSNPPAVQNGPSVVYPAGSGTREGSGIVAGWTYEGPATELQDHYVFGDENGLIWSIPMATLIDGSVHTGSVLENRTADFTPDAGSIDSPVGFATDDLGRFYILDEDGDVFRVDSTS